MNNATLINQDSGQVEFYTPEYIVSAARSLLGTIELDPASCEAANAIVQASVFFSKEQDGLSKRWFGRVWMNHPFDRNTNRFWIEKLDSEYRCGNVSEAVCICFGSHSEKWFRPLLEYPQCFIHGRVNYLDFTGKIKKGVTKGSVVTYLGSNIAGFYRSFNKLGTIKTAYKLAA